LFCLTQNETQMSVFENLLKKGIILRPVGNYGFPKYLRMTIGQADENKKAIAAIEKMLTEVPELV
jgi:histidinol-phosphate aminotransferase